MVLKTFQNHQQICPKIKSVGLFRSQTQKPFCCLWSSEASTNPTSPFGASRWFRSPPSPNPSPPDPFGERFTSPLPLSVDLSPGGLDVPGPALAAQSPSRSDQKIHQSFDRFLEPFLSDVGSENDPQNLPKSFQKQPQKSEFLKNRTSPTPEAHF